MRAEAKRLFAIFLAHVRCNLYLLKRLVYTQEPMFEFTCADNDNKVTLIAAVVGSLRDGSIQIKRVFYNTTGVDFPINVFVSMIVKTNS